MIAIPCVRTSRVYVKFGTMQCGLLSFAGTLLHSHAFILYETQSDLPADQLRTLKHCIQHASLAAWHGPRQRLQNASDADLQLYLLQLVQAGTLHWYRVQERLKCLQLEPPTQRQSGSSR